MVGILQNTCKILLSKQQNVFPQIAAIFQYELWVETGLEDPRHPRIKGER